MSKNYYNGAVFIGGAQMYYVRLGAGPKNAVILPGLSDGLVTVKGKAALLGKPYREFFRDFTVYMFSRKDPLPKEYSIREMAADQAEAMRILCLSGACVLGVSEGGMIVQYLACDYPELVNRLVLAVTAPYANGYVQTFVKKRIEEAKRGDHKAIMTGSAESAEKLQKTLSSARAYRKAEELRQVSEQCKRDTAI